MGIFYSYQAGAIWSCQISVGPLAPRAVGPGPNAPITIIHAEFADLVDFDSPFVAGAGVRNVSVGGADKTIRSAGLAGSTFVVALGTHLYTGFVVVIVAGTVVREGSGCRVRARICAGIETRTILASVVAFFTEGTAPVVIITCQLITKTGLG